MVIILKQLKTMIFTFIVLLNLFLINSVQAQNNSLLNSVEESFAVGTLMSDSDALSFGFANYDLMIDELDFSNEESQRYRNSLDVFSFPYTWELPAKSEAWDHAITMRAFYIFSKRNNQLVSGIDDTQKEHTFGLFGRYSQYFHVTDNWYVESALGLHFSFYQNTYSYGDGVTDEIKYKYDNKSFNTTALTSIIEPEVGIGYKKQESWGTWRIHHKTNYIYGHAIGGSILRKDSINPEAWHFTNGIEFAVNVPELWGVYDFLSIDFKRIELRGDLNVMAENNFYYETSFGWVIDTNKKIPFLDNIGIGIAINYGSSVSGGSIVLYYNE